MATSGGAFDVGGLFAEPTSLTEAEKLLALYFSSLSVGVCILDTDLRYLAINHPLAAITGIATEEHLGKTVRDVSPDFANLIEPQVQRVLSTGDPILRSKGSIELPAAQETQDFVQHYFPLRDATGKITRIGVIVETAAHKDPNEAKNLHKTLTRTVDSLQMVLDVTVLLSSNWDLPKVFPMISARIRRVLRHELASFALHDASSGMLVRQAIDFPLGKGNISNSPISVSNSPAGRSMAERATLIFSRKELEDFDVEITRSLVAEGIQSLCCVPLMRPHGPLGVFILGSTRKNAFRAEDEGLMNQVATQLALAVENQRAASEIETLKQRLSEGRRYLEGEIQSQGHFTEIVGDSLVLQQVLDQVATVSTSEATVLILGETGTGKELIARAIHRMSRRKDGPFIKVNCAAIPTGLLESELFGHEKGAFTGAISQKVGRMELADGGTLFLDEVGEIPLELQPKLLRVLQDQEFERLGSNRTLKVNVRLVAATNRNLAESMEQNRFRRDLFYRLSVFPVRLPALRERREDIPLLVRHFVRKFAQRMERYIETVRPETMRALKEWHWPGNVRELENLMERAVILTEGHALVVPLSELRPAVPPQGETKDHTLESAERSHIIRILRETGGRLSGPGGAAHRLGMKRTTLQSKMQRLKITRQDYSDRSQD